MSDNRVLSPAEAFEAMVLFLEAYRERGGGRDDLVAVLSDVQLITEDRRPADPAVWEDWLTAVRQVLDTAIVP